MREILFRGKRVDTSEWVYGGLIYGTKDSFIFERFMCRDDENTVELAENYRVIPETVGQYIGLKDKESNKIFDKDIISFISKDNRQLKSKVWWNGISYCVLSDYGVAEPLREQKELLIISNDFDVTQEQLK